MVPVGVLGDTEKPAVPAAAAAPQRQQQLLPGLFPMRSQDLLHAAGLRRQQMLNDLTARESLPSNPSNDEQAWMQINAGLQTARSMPNGMQHADLSAAFASRASSLLPPRMPQEVCSNPLQPALGVKGRKRPAPKRPLPDAANSLLGLLASPTETEKRIRGRPRKFPLLAKKVRTYTGI